jgi:N-methylhydantoinase A
MGGTSFDVSVIRDGQMTTNPEFELQGLPVLAPAVEVHTIGAGGGSVIHHGPHGGLRVGPQSAGAEPGPACYGRGGDLATVTDANVVLGRIPAGLPISDAFTLDRETAEAALTAVAEEFGIDAVELSEQALEIAHFAMAQAIRELTVERGLDPSDFALCAFGGAGGLHAAFLAEELGVTKIVLPAHQGVLSAWGMLRSDIKHDAVQAFHRSFTAGLRDARELFEALIAKVDAVLEHGDHTQAPVEHELAADLRYVGQGYFLSVPVASPELDEDLNVRFHQLYHARYGHSHASQEIEFVALRVTGTRSVGSVGIEPLATGRSTASGFSTVTPTVFNGETLATRVIERDALDQELTGPAVIVDATGTAVLPPHWRARRIEHGHLLMERFE